MWNDDLKNYYQWLKDNGCKFNGVDIRKSKGLGNGLFAIKNFSTGDHIISIPRKFIITNSSVSKIDLYDVFMQRCEMTPQEVLTLFILGEDCDPSSKYIPYLKLLPRTFNNVNFTGSDESVRGNSYLYSRYKERENQIEAMFEKFRRIYGNIYLSHFRWAWQIVISRCIYPVEEEFFRESKALAIIVPLADMINYSTNPSVSYFYDVKTDCLKIIARKRILPYSELFLRIGMSNEILWFDHGFTMIMSSNAELRIDIDLFEEVMKNLKVTLTSEHKRIALEDNSSSSSYLVYKKSGFVSLEQFKRTMKILTMNTNELKNWKDVLMSKSDVNETFFRDVITELILFYTRERKSAPEFSKWYWNDIHSVLYEIRYLFSYEKKNIT